MKDKNTTKCGEEVQVKNIKTNKRKEISSKEGGKSQTDKQEPRKVKGYQRSLSMMVLLTTFHLKRKKQVMFVRRKILRNRFLVQ